MRDDSTWSGPETRAVLLRAVRAAWERGYEPADLLRIASRRFGGGHVALLRHVVLAELDGYPSATLDRRWREQRADLEEAAGLPPASPVVCDVAWADLAPHAAVLLHLLSGLPALQPLGPLPGSAKSDGDDPVVVDGRVLERVRALLAKAESTPYPAEAETFTAGAQALMARHSIDAALLAARAGRQARGPGGVRVGIDPPYETPKVSLLTAVAAANRCRSVWSKELGFCTVVGFAVDVELVQTLFTSLLLQATAAMTREGARVDHSGRSRTRAFRHAFLLAYATRIGERLAQAAAAAEHESLESAAGAGLLPVLAHRELEVEHRLAELFPRLRRSRSSTVTDGEGWASGRAAADLADVGPQGRLAGER